MIIHCSSEFAVELPLVSKMPLKETGAFGAWHGHLFAMQQRQCALFCHDATRFMLFMPRWRTDDAASLDAIFGTLFSNTMLKMNYPGSLRERGISLLTTAYFDMAVSASVRACMDVAIRDIEWWMTEAPNLMDLPIETLSARMNQRPMRLKGMKAGEVLWPEQAMREFIEQAFRKRHLRLVQ